MEERIATIQGYWLLVAGINADDEWAKRYAEDVTLLLGIIRDLKGATLDQSKHLMRMIMQQGK